jgi:hypothetical protein
MALQATDNPPVVQIEAGHFHLDPVADHDAVLGEDHAAAEYGANAVTVSEPHQVGSARHGGDGAIGGIIQYQPEMNSAPVRPASFSERAAYHEAEHCAAALAYGIPIISVSIDADTPHLHRGRNRAPHDCGLECMVTLCLAGPASEELFCGRIEDGSDQSDVRMARE